MARDHDEREAALIRAALRGSRRAYGRLIDGYQSRLFRFLRMRTETFEDAEELLQDCLLRCWTRLHQFDPQRRFASWLFTVAARLAVSRSRRPQLPRAAGDALAELTSPGGPVDSADQRELRHNLWDIARRVLSAEARSALWLFYAEGMSAREVGVVLDKREDAVRAMMWRARERLAAHLPRPSLCGDES